MSISLLLFNYDNNNIIVFISLLLFNYDNNNIIAFILFLLFYYGWFVMIFFCRLHLSCSGGLKRLV